MYHKNVGKAGLRVSALGLGTWVTFGSQISEQQANDIVKAAYEHGINLFDTAEVYAAGKAEVILGNILRRNGWKRTSYIITTKIFWGGKCETERGLSRKHIIEGLQNSLQRLGLEYVDIVFANKNDPNVTMEEIVRAFTYCIEKGWAMYWGTSRWSGQEIMEAYSVARQFNQIPPIVEQAEYNMLTREKVETMMPELKMKIGLGCITWSPLSCGVLTGKYMAKVPEGSRATMRGYSWLHDKCFSDEGRQIHAKLKLLEPMCIELECTHAQLAIAWCLRLENNSSVLIGASSPEQLLENLRAVEIVKRLTPQHLQRIDAILDNCPVRRDSSHKHNENYTDGDHHTALRTTPETKWIKPGSGRGQGGPAKPQRQKSMF